jgi:hypothetical protein
VGDVTGKAREESQMHKKNEMKEKKRETLRPWGAPTREELSAMAAVEALYPGKKKKKAPKGNQ